MKAFPPEEKKAILREMKGLLEGLKGVVPELNYIEVGLNHQLESTNYDLALITHFNSLEDLESYKIHPSHQVVVKRMGEVAETRAAVDFEF